MKTLKMQPGQNESVAQKVSGLSESGLQAQVDADLSQHSTALDWDAMISDYAVIERRAQAMRSEAAWNLARAVRDWALKVFSQGKAKAGAATATPLARQGQPI